MSDPKLGAPRPRLRLAGQVLNPGDPGYTEARARIEAEERRLAALEKPRPDKADEEPEL